MGERILEITVVKHEPVWVTPTCYALRVPMYGSVKNIKDALTEICDLKRNRIGIADIYQHRVYSFLPERKPLFEIQAKDTLYAFELPENFSTPMLRRIQIIQGKKSKDKSLELFGLPFLQFFDTQTTTGKKLYDMLWTRIKVWWKGFKEPLQEYPFTLRVVTSCGTNCGLCTSRSCKGCEIHCDEEKVPLENNGHTVAMCWDRSFLQYFDNDTATMILKPNASWNCPKCSLSITALEDVSETIPPAQLVNSLKAIIRERKHLREVVSQKDSQIKQLSAELQTKVEELESITLCQICYEHPKSAVLQPCGHTMCRKCATTISKKNSCPFCVQRVSKIFSYFP